MMNLILLQERRIKMAFAMLYTLSSAVQYIAGTH